jgi:hypothetical protein
VDELKTRIWVYPTLREVVCPLCGTLYEQQYAAVALFQGAEHIGDLCPRCLWEGPCRTATRVRAHVARLQAQRSPATGVAADTVPLTGESGSAPAVASATPVTAPPEMLALPQPVDAGKLLALADLLEKMESWGIAVAELQEMEKSVLRQRFLGLREEDLRKLVDDRYQEFMDRSP